MYPRIRELRKKKGISQAWAAECLGCFQQAYRNYELGQRDIPTKMLIKLAKFYEVSVDDILGLSNKD